MLSKTKISFGGFVIGAIGSLVFIFLVPLYYSAKVSAEEQWKEKAAVCYETNVNDDEKINCWFEIIREKFTTGGTQKAFDVFEYVYQNYDVFANTGCHRHAHRVGDLSYYFDYFNHKDFSKMDFPRNAVACGYGFYHGFFEHLIQDNPDPEFVTTVCEYMRNNLYEVAPAISQTCYHGSGHGFTLARADLWISDSQWTTDAFIDEPLKQCESLSDADEYEISECRQGVYNVIVDWMADGEYGMTYNRDNPFAFCDSEEYHHQPDCYYEMAQKMDSVSDHDPVKAVEIAKRAVREDLWSTIIKVAIAGMVQHDPKGDQSRLVTACRLVTLDLLEVCLQSIVSGLIEHNTGGQDFSNVISFCANDEFSEIESDLCYEGLAKRLDRFYTKIEIKESCEFGVYPEKLCIYVP